MQTYWNTSILQNLFLAVLKYFIMGTFFRVIYTKILYRIPLKYLLIILAVVAVCIASFSNAWLVKTSYQAYVWSQNDKTYVNNSCDMICINPNWSTCNDIDLAFNLNHWRYAWSIHWWWDIGSTYWFCSSEHTVYFSSFDWCSFTIDCYNFTEYTSLQCQTEYSLIPISEVDSSYCESNNLCSSSECPDNPNVWTSNLYINDVFHPWAFNVIVNIPEEIDRDYAYTNSWSNFNLDVVWYNQDTEYIESLIDINSYKPTSEDFTSVFSLFWEYWWLLVACLFVILLFYFIKRPFK